MAPLLAADTWGAIAALAAVISLFITWRVLKVAKDTLSETSQADSAARADRDMQLRRQTQVDAEEGRQRLLSQLQVITALVGELAEEINNVRRHMVGANVRVQLLQHRLQVALHVWTLLGGEDFPKCQDAVGSPVDVSEHVNAALDELLWAGESLSGSERDQ